jgi:hypothetical protein
MELAVLLMKVDSSTFTHTETHKSKEHTITLRDQFKVSLMGNSGRESFKNRNCRLSKSWTKFLTHL